MTAQPLATDVLSPPAAGGSAQVQAADALAGELLEQFRLEQLETDLAAASPRPQAPWPPRPPLPQEVEDALYAWGVSCHEAGRHADASALFGALCRRQPASVRLLKAAGASHLACGDPARSAQAYAFARLHLVIEPGGAAALAAVLSGQVPSDGRTAVILSGGNVDPDAFVKAISCN